MNPFLRKQFVPLTDEAQIGSFEAAIGYRLPNDYRDFLLEFNGGEPFAPVIRWGRDEPYSDSTIRYFFSITDNSTFSLAYKYAIYAGANRVSKEMLPIAGDFGGNLVLLSLAGADAGKIFFWNHDVEGLYDDPSSMRHLSRLAVSFRQFCETLKTESALDK
jgi:hypothetical protein